MMKIFGTMAAVAALALTATPAIAAPVEPARQATATARIIKPLTLTWFGDLNFGSITLVDAGPTTIAVARDGTRSCPGTAVSCSGSSSAAWYKITGVNNQVVTVNSGNVSLANTTDPTLPSLLMNIDAPASINLANSGNTGTDLFIGGNVSVSGATAEGVYVGTLAVTVNY
jgi:hypothetical protein